MKLLLLGSAGQVGWELQRSLAPIGQLVALTRDTSTNPAGLVGDLADPDGLVETIDAVRPDWIVNAAAYTAVDSAESDQDSARLVNADAPAAIAHAANRIGAGLIHYSTDYVFDGSGTMAWREDDATGPLGTYGKTKLAGEEAIRCSGCRHMIFRTSWVYAARGSNFVKTMLRLATERESLSVVADQIGAPTGAELLADATALTLRAPIEGTFHLAAGGETSWHGFASFVIEAARNVGVPIRVADDAIHPIPSEAFPTPAVRPRNSRLDTAKFSGTFGVTLPDWRVPAARTLREIIG